MFELSIDYRLKKPWQRTETFVTFHFLIIRKIDQANAENPLKWT